MYNNYQLLAGSDNMQVGHSINTNRINSAKLTSNILGVKKMEMLQDRPPKQRFGVKLVKGEGMQRSKSKNNYNGPEIRYGVYQKHNAMKRQNSMFSKKITHIQDFGINGTKSSINNPGRRPPKVPAGIDLNKYM